MLLERKLLGYIQDRKGPNKVIFLGVFQPFSDAIKLFVKEYIMLIKVNLLIYFTSPIFGFFIALILLVGLPLRENLFSMNLFMLYIIRCLRIGVYVIIIRGWSSNSNYSTLGGVRSVAQSLSYEVSIFLIFFVIFLYVERFKLIDFLKYQDGLLEFWYINRVVFILLFISIVAELNRIPFDFIEGESELVSGFNIEYIRGGFTLIFLAEYIIILILGILFSLIFIGGSFNIKWVVEVLIFRILIIWIRGCFPRLRYDNLIYFCWYYILSITILILLIVFVLKYALWFNI